MYIWLVEDDINVRLSVYILLIRCRFRETINFALQPPRFALSLTHLCVVFLHAVYTVILKREKNRFYNPWTALLTHFWKVYVRCRQHTIEAWVALKIVLCYFMKIKCVIKCAPQNTSLDVKIYIYSIKLYNDFIELVRDNF